MKTRLTREESQHLIDLGVPKEKASGKYIVPRGKPIVTSVGVLNETDEIYPIFKLEDFLNGDILPKEIKPKNSWQSADYYELVLIYTKEDEWDANYYSWNCGEFLSNIPENPELVNSLYRLACWYYGEYLKSEKK